MAGEIVIIELTADIERAFPVPGFVNAWPAGTTFAARRNITFEGWTVTDGPEAGLGIGPDCAVELSIVQSNHPTSLIRWGAS